MSVVVLNKQQGLVNSSLVVGHHKPCPPALVNMRIANKSPAVPLPFFPSLSFVAAPQLVQYVNEACANVDGFASSSQHSCLSMWGHEQAVIGFGF
jgi:hypothetical protein